MSLTGTGELLARDRPESRHRRKFGLPRPEGYDEGVVDHGRANHAAAIRDDADDRLASLAAPAVYEPGDVVRRGDRRADSTTTPQEEADAALCSAEGV